MTLSPKQILGVAGLAGILGGCCDDLQEERIDLEFDTPPTPFDLDVDRLSALGEQAQGVSKNTPREEICNLVERMHAAVGDLFRGHQWVRADAPKGDLLNPDYYLRLSPVFHSAALRDDSRFSHLKLWMRCGEDAEKLGCAMRSNIALPLTANFSVDPVPTGDAFIETDFLTSFVDGVHAKGVIPSNDGPTPRAFRYTEADLTRRNNETGRGINFSVLCAEFAQEAARQRAAEFRAFVEEVLKRK